MKKEGVECGKCWYWHKVNENLGDCRANPPISMAALVGSDPKRGSWLQTSREDWCGSFKVDKVQASVRAV